MTTGASKVIAGNTGLIPLDIICYDLDAHCSYETFTALIDLLTP